jgi:hypothetical protein
MIALAREELAWLPLLVPVGDDASGTYLLHLEPGEVVSLEGSRRPFDAGILGTDRQVLALGRASGRSPQRSDSRSTRNNPRTPPWRLLSAGGDQAVFRGKEDYVAAISRTFAADDVG